MTVLPPLLAGLMTIWSLFCNDFKAFSYSGLKLVTLLKETLRLDKSRVTCLTKVEIFDCKFKGGKDFGLYLYLISFESVCSITAARVAKVSMSSPIIDFSKSFNS